MLSFVLFNGETPGPAFPLRHAFLLGPESIGLGVDITLSDDGVIRCQLPERSSAALSLQVPLNQIREDHLAGDADDRPPLGRLSLRTCLLPPRERPYLLSLELARHRIMLFLNKLEDWALFDLPAEDPILAQFERARQTFTQALVAEREGVHADNDPLGHTVEADRLAWRALALAIDAGEQLALRDAARDILPRLSGETYREAVDAYIQASGDKPPPNVPIIVQNSLGVTLPGRPVVGCSVSPARFSEALQRCAVSACDFINLPMRWVDMEPEEGAYSFAGTDRWIEWAVRKARLPVFAGPVIDFRSADIPEWIYIWENDYETLRELVYEHVKSIVTRYRRTVTRWTIASGLHVNSNFRMSYEQIMDLTRLCVLLVKKLQPTAKIQVEIDQPWGEHYAHSRQSIPPVLYADTIAQAGIPVDAFAVRLVMGQPGRGCSTRDLMELSSILDRFAALERPLLVTACAAPSAPVAANAEGPESDPGFWREPWSDHMQTAWLANAASVALAKPYVLGICWADLADAPGAPPGIGLATAEGTPKPALDRLASIRRSLLEGKSWINPE